MIICKMFDSFCKKVVKNTFLNEIKPLKRRQWQEQLVPDMPKHCGLVTWTDTYPSDSVSITANGWMGSVQSERLYMALRKLSNKQQQVILLSYWHGYRDKEIAQAIRMPRSTVNYLRNRALKRLKSIMKEHYNDVELQKYLQGHHGG